MREYNALEQCNVKLLVDKGVAHATLQITETGRAKSIMDATAPVRTFLKEHGIHDYQAQPQGPANKVLKHATILTSATAVDTTMSLYRPMTKKGDPRLWISKITNYSKADDILALFVHDGDLCVVNLTDTDIADACRAVGTSPLKDIITEEVTLSSSVSKELLGRIIETMSEWTPVEVDADTGVGRTVETCLGIGMNSDKAPDYKGIELKSKRDYSIVRNTLFTQTPNWDLSRFKSAREICNRYGYYDDTGDRVKRLRVTLKAGKPNPQGLALNVNLLAGLLEANEYAIPQCPGLSPRKKSDVIVWELKTLHRRLLTKHHETFWIDAETKEEKGHELFRVKSILHTKNPSTAQFDVLLEQRHISVDLLLCRPKHRGDTYSFKIDPKSKPLLFPDIEVYTINH